MENKQVENVEKQSFWKDERGDIGIKQIAITVGIIVIIAFAIGLIKDSFLEGWIKDVWKMFMDAIKDMTGTA